MNKNVHKNRIGARHLTETEATLILPTYAQIDDQINQFRNEKKDMSRSSGLETLEQSIEQGAKKQNINQKTNNIGIIGVRGAGKTSLLKTIQAKLERNRSKTHDTILPIIVPENMSESSTLMAAILGMISDHVREYDKKQNEERQKRNENCVKESELRKKCNEAIKQYTYIQKEYRDILLQEYTTQNDYVNRSAEVFNSDTEFISKFNELIDEMVNADKKESALVFLFIDDIDLSTYRCADVVKTLLSYLSNVNIVTFISGDLETFEEALTLDFLRQEKVLDKNILESEIGSKKILESKKLLAYEYLKKIIPPVYRHNIKAWSLEDKGNYGLSVSKQKGDQFSELLKKALEGWVEPAFFSYAENEEDKEALPYTYHLFDDTSRGLNNVYNVLNEIANKRKSERINEGEDYIKEKKLLLDTIVASKPIYNKYRNKIQKNMFFVGMSSKEGRVFFDNVKEIIYGGDRSKISTQARVYPVEDAVERFSLFILADFAARILYEDNYTEIVNEDGNYKELKKKAMIDLFFNPVIAEKVMDVSGLDWEDMENKTAEKEEHGRMTLYGFIKSFLLSGELVLNLAFYKNLELSETLAIYKEKEKQEEAYPVELNQKVVLAVWKALTSIAKVNGDKEPGDKAAEYYPVFWKEFAYIQKNLSNSVTRNIVMQLFDEECEEALNKNNNLGEQEKWEQRRERQERKRILLNMIAKLIEDPERESVKEEFAKTYYDGAEEEIQKKREKAIKIIDEKKLWKSEVAETVIEYIKKEIITKVEKIGEQLTFGECMVNIEDAYKSWESFYYSYSGISWTKADETKAAVEKIIRRPNRNGSKDDINYRVSFEEYDKLSANLDTLARNSRVWYGRSESQEMLNFLQEAYAEPEGDLMQKKNSDLVFLLLCSYKYKMARTLDSEVVRIASLLAKVKGQLLTANVNADKQTLSSFIEKLNADLPDAEKIGVEDFNKLFS